MFNFDLIHNLSPMDLEQINTRCEQYKVSAVPLFVSFLNNLKPCDMYLANTIDQITFCSFQSRHPSIWNKISTRA